MVLASWLVNLYIMCVRFCHRKGGGEEKRKPWKSREKKLWTKRKLDFNCSGIKFSVLRLEVLIVERATACSLESQAIHGTKKRVFSSTCRTKCRPFFSKSGSLGYKLCSCPQARFYVSFSASSSSSSLAKTFLLLPPIGVVAKERWSHKRDSNKIVSSDP